MKLLPAQLEYGLLHPKHRFLERLPTREVDRLHLHVEQVRSAAEV